MFVCAIRRHPAGRARICVVCMSANSPPPFLKPPGMRRAQELIRRREEQACAGCQLSPVFRLLRAGYGLQRHVVLSANPLNLHNAGAAMPLLPAGKLHERRRSRTRRAKRQVDFAYSPVHRFLPKCCASSCTNQRSFLWYLTTVEDACMIPVLGSPTPPPNGIPPPPHPPQAEIV